MTAKRKFRASFVFVVALSLIPASGCRDSKTVTGIQSPSTGASREYGQCPFWDAQFKCNGPSGGWIQGPGGSDSWEQPNGWCEFQDANCVLEVLSQAERAEFEAAETARLLGHLNEYCFPLGTRMDVMLNSVGSDGYTPAVRVFRNVSYVYNWDGTYAGYLGGDWHHGGSYDPFGEQIHIFSQGSSSDRLFRFRHELAHQVGTPDVRPTTYYGNDPYQMDANQVAGFCA